jgi:hypothetical protein
MHHNLLCFSIFLSLCYPHDFDPRSKHRTHTCGFVGNNLLDGDAGIDFYLMDLLMSVSVHKYNVFCWKMQLIPSLYGVTL